jgi:protein-tyrosine phosphatase
MFNGVYEVTRADVMKGVENLNRLIRAEGLPLTVVPGAEVHIRIDLCRLVEEGKVLTLGDGGRYLLLELPSSILPSGLELFLFSLNLAGVVPVISHPEHNMEFQSAPEKMADLAVSGTLFQIRADSLLGRAGRRAHKCARWLLDSGLAHLVASDAHDTKVRAPSLEGAFDLVKRRLGREEADEIFFHRPARILAGGVVEIPEARKTRCPGLLRRWVLKKSCAGSR